MEKHKLYAFKENGVWYIVKGDSNKMHRIVNPEFIKYLLEFLNHDGIEFVYYPIDGMNLEEVTLGNLPKSE